MSEPWLLDRALSAEARVDALLERVKVLERALEEITYHPYHHGTSPVQKAREALDG